MRHKRYRLDPWVRKIPWRRAWQPTPCLQNPMERGAWRTIVHAQGQTWLKQLCRNTKCPVQDPAHRDSVSISSPSLRRKDCREIQEMGLLPEAQSSVTQSCPTLCHPMNRSMPGLPVHHKLPEFTQTRVHRVGDAIQLSHPLSSPSPPAPNPSQHQGLFQWVNSSHEVAKVLEFQFQHQSYQWTPRTDLLQDGLVGSPCSLRNSQESPPIPQSKGINSSAISFLHSPTLTSIHDHWKNHSLD